MTTEAKAPTLVKACFFSRVLVELKKLFVHAPGWEASAAATLTYVAPLVETLVVLVDPGVAPVVNAIIQKVQSAMAAAAVVVKDAGPAPTLVTYLNAINSDLEQIETVAAIKDPVVAQRLQTTIATITAEVNAIKAEIAAVAA